MQKMDCFFKPLIHERLEPQHQVTSLLHHPMILFNYVIQVFAGLDDRLSGQGAFDFQFGDGLVGRPTAVEEFRLLRRKSGHAEDYP